MSEQFHFFRDHTGDLGTDQDPGPDYLICVGSDRDPAAWPFPLPYSAVLLFEALPDTFTFEDLTEEGDRQGLSAARSVEHLRTWEELKMVEIDGEKVYKTGQKPYF